MAFLDQHTSISVFVRVNELHVLLLCLCTNNLHKTVNTGENVYCFATNQVRDETATDNLQTAAWSSHVLTRKTSWLFLPRQIFMFTAIKCWTCPFSISTYVSANSRYERYFTEKQCWIEQTGSDSAGQRVWEQNKWANHKRCWTALFHVQFKDLQKVILDHTIASG